MLSTTRNIFLFIFLLSFQGFSQIKVSGLVLDIKTKKVVSNVAVIFQQKNGVFTDESGYFEIVVDSLPQKLFFKLIGYETKSHTFYSANFDTIYLLSSSTNLNQVVVSANRQSEKVSESFVSIKSVSQNFIDNNNSITINDVLDKIPGVQVFNNQVNIRGGSGYTLGAGSRVQIMVDDMPMLEAFAGDARWNFIPIENIASVEVVKGSASSLYGSGALNGVVNIRTAWPEQKKKTTIRFSQSIYDNPPKEFKRVWQGRNPITSNLDITHLQKIGNFDLVVGLNLLKDEGFRISEWSNRIRQFGKVRYTSKNDKWTFQTSWNVLFDSSAVFYFWKSDSLAYLPVEDFIRNQYFNYISIDPKIIHRIDSNWTLTNKNRYFYTINHQFYNELNLSYSNHNNLQLQFGLVNIHNKVGDSLFNNTSSNYGQADWKWRKWKIGLGYRFERIVKTDKNPVVFPVYRIGTNYTVNSKMHLRASLGTGFRYPTLLETDIRTTGGQFNLFPNAYLRPEKGLGYEIGWNYLTEKKRIAHQFDVALFVSKYSDMIDLSFGLFIPLNPDTPFILANYIGARAENIVNSKISGIELNYDNWAKWRSYTIRFQAGYTYINPVYAGKNVALNPDDKNAKYLKYRTQHLVRSDISLEKNKFGVGANLRYNSFMINIDQIFTLYLPGVKEFRERHSNGDFIADLRFYYSIKENLKLSFITRNAFNRAYMSVPGNVGAPRSFALQVKAYF